MSAFPQRNPAAAAAAAAAPSPDVFKALGTGLYAYPVFFPEPEACSFEPLYIAELKHSAGRKDTLIPYNLSLRGIVDRVLQIRQTIHPSQTPYPDARVGSCKLFIPKLIFSHSSPDGDAAFEVWTELQSDLAENISSRVQVLDLFARVSTSSLKKLGAGLVYPSSIMGGADHVLDNLYESTINLEDVSIRTYSGDNLDSFILVPSCFLYETLLMYQLPHLAVPNIGDRSLLAIVRSSITGKLLVSIESLEKRTGLFGLLTRAVSRRRTDDMRKENVLSGVLGLSFTVIPVERINTSKWRFYPSFPVTRPEIDETEEDSGENDDLFRAKNWAERKEGARLLTEILHHDIDISECKPEFAHVQCLLALQLRDYVGPSKEDDSSQQKRLETSSRMLRSAAELGSQMAVKELAVSYRQGLGVEKNIEYAEQLESETELPDPPQNDNQGDHLSQTGDTDLRGDDSERKWLVTSDARVKDTSEPPDASFSLARLRMRKMSRSGRLGRRYSWIRVKGNEGFLREGTWWMEDRMPQMMSGLTRLGKFEELSTDDRMALHMRTIVREGDPVDVTLHGYHTFRIPAADETMRVYSLTSEIKEGGLSRYPQRVAHISQLCFNDTDDCYFFARPWRSSIFQDYVSRNTSGINVQFVAGVEEDAEGYDGYLFDYDEIYDPFRFTVEDYMPGRGGGPHRGNGGRFLRDFTLEQDWLFAKRGQVVPASASWQYLRYGYYFVLEKAINAQLYALVDGSGAKIYVYDAIKKKFRELHDYSYFVIKVGLCADIPQRWEGSTTKRAVRLREVCDNAESMDAEELKREIVSIMSARNGVGDEGRALAEGSISSSSENGADTSATEDHIARYNRVLSRLGRPHHMIY